MHFIRLLGSMRFLGTMLLMLWVSQFQLDGGKTAAAAGMDKAHQLAVRAVPAASAALEGFADRTDPAPPAAVMSSVHTSVFHRLKPGIVMVPRMNRVPKPKSVHRSFARSPGAPIVLVSHRRGTSIHTLST